MGKSDTEVILSSSALSEDETTASPVTAADMKTRGWRNLWLQPFLLAILILTGLIGALASDGVWDLFFCLLLAWPVFKMGYHYYRG